MTRALCLLALSAAGLLAQVSTASINGTVTDASGATVPQAALLLKNTQTGVETRTTANEQGVYVILNILPGNYTLEATMQGFSSSQIGRASCREQLKHRLFAVA